MGKTIVVADVHASRHKGSDIRLKHCLQALEWSLSQAEGGSLIVAGDLFHDRTKIDVSVLVSTYDVIRRWSDRVRIYLLVGNHDMYLKDDRTINSLRIFESIATVITQPCTVSVEGEPMDFLPYTEERLTKDLLDTLFPKKSPVLIAHISLKGAVLNSSGTIAGGQEHDPDGLEDEIGSGPSDPDGLVGWNTVLCGHYHVPQVVKESGPRIEYVGSVLQHTFGEVGSQSRIVQVDAKSGAIATIPNTFSPRFIAVKAEDLADPNVSSNVKGNWVRITLPPMPPQELLVEARKFMESNGAIGLDFRKWCPPKHAGDATQVATVTDDDVEKLRQIVDDPRSLARAYVEAGPTSWVGSKEEVAIYPTLDTERLVQMGSELIDSLASVQKPKESESSKRKLHVKSMSIRNFMSVTDELKIDLESLPQMVLVSGEGEGDSTKANGMGKSAIFIESLAWCLHGNTLRGLRKSGVINSVVGKSCSVTVEVNDLSVVRSAKPDQFKVTRISTGEDLTKATVAETQSWLQDELGVTWGTFEFLACFDAETWRGFIGATEKERRDMVESLFSMEEYNELLAEARKWSNATEKEVSKVAAELAVHKANLESRKTALVSHAEKDRLHKESVAQRLAQAKAELESIPQIDIAAEEAKIASNESIHEAMRSDSEKYNEAVKKIAELESTLKSDREALATEQGSLTSLTSMMESYAKVNWEAEEKVIDAEIAAQLEEQEASKLINELVTQIASTTSSISSINGDVSRLESSSIQFKQMDPGATCPTCYSTVHEEHVASVLAEITRQKDEATARLQPLIAIQSQLTEAKASTESRLLTLKARVKPSHTKESLSNERLRFSQLGEQASASIQKITAIESKLATSESQLQPMKDEAEVFSSAIKSARETLRTDVMTRQELAEAAGRRSQAEGNVARIQAEVDGPSPYTALVNQTQVDIVEAENQVAESRKSLDELEDLLPYRKFWAKAYEPAGIRSLAISQVIHALNSEVSRWLSHEMLGGDVSISFDASLDAKVTWLRTNTEAQYAQLSSGEKRRLDLATLFAFSQVVQAVHGTEMDYIVFDEVADKLDADGIRGVAAALTALSMDKRVIVITHHPTLRENLSAGCCAVVSKVDGKTSVSFST